MNVLDIHKNKAENLGFWEEMPKGNLLALVQSAFVQEAIKGYSLVDITITGDKVLIKWAKNFEFKP